jgi:hypothetical protein
MKNLKYSLLMAFVLVLGGFILPLSAEARNPASIGARSVSAPDGFRGMLKTERSKLYKKARYIKKLLKVAGVRSFPKKSSSNRLSIKGKKIPDRLSNRDLNRMKSKRKYIPRIKEELTWIYQDIAQLEATLAIR